VFELLACPFVVFVTKIKQRHRARIGQERFHEPRLLSPSVLRLRLWLECLLPGIATKSPHVKEAFKFLFAVELRSNACGRFNLGRFNSPPGGSADRPGRRELSASKFA